MHAKPDAEKNNDTQFIPFLLHTLNSLASYENADWMFNPPWVGEGSPLNPPEGALIQILRGTELCLLGIDDYVEIDGTTITLSPEKFSCTYDVNWNYDRDVAGRDVYKLKETIIIDSVEYEGIIEIKAVETVYYDGVDFWGAGTFVGHSIINGEKVQVMGERDVVVTFLTGPPGIEFVMEEKGTIMGLD